MALFFLLVYDQKVYSSPLTRPFISSSFGQRAISKRESTTSRRTNLHRLLPSSRRANYFAEGKRKYLNRTHTHTRKSARGEKIRRKITKMKNISACETIFPPSDDVKNSRAGVKLWLLSHRANVFWEKEKTFVVGKEKRMRAREPKTLRRMKACHVAQCFRALHIRLHFFRAFRSLFVYPPSEWRHQDHRSRKQWEGGEHSADGRGWKRERSRLVTGRIILKEKTFFCLQTWCEHLLVNARGNSFRPRKCSGPVVTGNLFNSFSCSIQAFI